MLGRAGATSETPTETLSWSGGQSTVTPSEVLTADEVVDLFIAYHGTGDVPSAFSRRPLTAPTRQ